ncbi:hypothetical protein KB972_002280 [Vibrio parahaemolyticus]|uniref:hypothetical protein n=1 Tax=Vibrio harveyi group TaxID=717610 RepID=UPI0011122A8A|nr:MULTISPECIES: hypothetical protein [Vibrio harveyi group]EHJ9993054.1 hypothetical protein [Vibrio parahaemolyticus]MCR9364142.1 hypothetical protein [Vibrio antiquarius]
MDLYINVGAETQAQFIEQLSRCLPSNWMRDLKRESEVPNFGQGSMYCFDRNENDGLDAKLWLVSSSENQLRVSNIVPTTVRELDIENYNKLLVEFYSLGIEELVKNNGGTVELTNEQYDLEDLVSKELAKSLRIFSSHANKSTGHNHPSDKERWFDFIIQSHKSQQRLSPEELQVFLVHDGWAEDFAFDLACDYESSLDLLAFYEGKQ